MKNAASGWVEPMHCVWAWAARARARASLERVLWEQTNNTTNQGQTDFFIYIYFFIDTVKCVFHNLSI